MQIISVASSKGGSGKTTLASALAVRAVADGKRVALVDLDPQESLVEWWKRRGRSDNPWILSNVDTASDAVEALELTERPDYVFFDTPPAFLPIIEDAIRCADVALIPLKASAIDLIASEDAVLMARSAGVDHLCVINDAEPRWKTTQGARDYLLASGVPVADAIIAHRQSYLGAMTLGKTGPEVDRSREQHAASEINALWAEVKARLAKAARAKAKGARRV